MVGDEKNKGLLPNTLKWLFNFKKEIEEFTKKSQTPKLKTQIYE
jgi:hypothetical protein